MVRLSGEEVVILSIRVSQRTAELIREAAYKERLSKRQVIERAIMRDLAPEDAGE